MHPAGSYYTNIQNFFYIIFLLRIWQIIVFLRKTGKWFEAAARIVRMCWRERRESEASDYGHFSGFPQKISDVDLFGFTYDFFNDAESSSRDRRSTIMWYVNNKSHDKLSIVMWSVNNESRDRRSIVMLSVNNKSHDKLSIVMWSVTNESRDRRSIVMWSVNN